MSKEADEFFAWRNTMRRKHRVMTWAEYRAWCRVGDDLSHSSDAGAFPGGLTIVFGSNSGIFGKCVDSTST